MLANSYSMAEKSYARASPFITLGSWKLTMTSCKQYATVGWIRREVKSWDRRPLAYTMAWVHIYRPFCSRYQIWPKSRFEFKCRTYDDGGEQNIRTGKRPENERYTHCATDKTLAVWNERSDEPTLMKKNKSKF
jgi:hypothetical protein